MRKLDIITAVQEARAIIAMAAGPFCAAELAAALRPLNAMVADCIPSVAALECCRLTDGRYVTADFAT
jgi:hypothetical protein